MENTVNQRIKVLSEKKKSVRQFAAALGFSDTAIRKIINGETKPGYDVLSAILTYDENISSDWLIKGEGSMYKSEQKDISVSDGLLAELREELKLQRNVINHLLSSSSQDLAKLLGSSVTDGFLLAA